MILIPQNAIMRNANFVASVVIMHCSEQSLATVSDFMTMLVIVICVGPENAGTTISNFLAMLVVMICAVRQNALTTGAIRRRIGLKPSTNAKP